jgi:CheY-like chemotaxis protein
VLVAHPSRVVQRTFALVLESEGLLVVPAVDADDALQSVAEHDPGVVLLHPDLPGFDRELPRSLAGGGAQVLLLDGDELGPPYLPRKIAAAVLTALGR